jgi:DNA-binding FrmR family transcriptional regulator
MTTIVQTTTPDEMVTRLRRIEGQVRGVQHMIERGESCTDVLTQVSATRAALTAVARCLVDCEIRRAVQVGADAADSSVADVLAAVDLLAGR